MKHGKRFLSLLLAVIMVGSLMLSGVSATTVASDSNVIMSESFETWANVSTAITSDYSVQGGTTSWNGATPAEGWAISAQNGKVLVQPALEGAQDGNVSMKLTLGTDATTMNRAKLQYRMPQSVYDKMEHGAEYTFTVYFKGTAKANYEVKTFVPGVTNWPNNDVAISGEWAKTEYVFTLDKETPNPAGGVTTLDIFIGIPWHAAGALSGELYIDNVSIVKTKDAPKPEGGEGGDEEEADPNVIFEEDFDDLSALGVSGAAGAVFNENYWGADAFEFSADAKSGSKSIKLMAEKMTSKPSWTQNEYGIGRLTLLLDIAKFEVGATYKVSGWFKASEGCPQLDIDAQAYGQTGQLNVGDPVKDAGTDWYKYEVEFVMPEGITATQLVFRFGVSYPVADTTPYALVDDISIVKTKDAPKPEGGEEEVDPNAFFAEGFEEITSLETPSEIPLDKLVNELYWGAGEAEVITSDAHTGDKSVKLTPTKMTSKPSWTQNEYGIGRLMYKADVSKLEVGATYKVSAWFKADRASARANINVQANPYTILNIDQGWTDVGTDWVLKEVEFVMPEGSQDYMIFRFGYSFPVADETQYFLVDDISIVKTKDASAPDGGEEEEVDPNEIYAEDFEDVSNLIVGNSADVGVAFVEPYWNGGSYAFSTDAHSGSKSVKLTATKHSNTATYITSDYAMGFVTLLLDVSKLEVGATYKTSAYFKGSQAETNANMLVQANPYTVYNDENKWADVGTDWVLKEVEFVMPEGSDRYMKLRFGSGTYCAEDAYILVDDIKVVKTKDAPKPGEENEESIYGKVFEESFESFANANTVITDIYSSGSVSEWNGATVGTGWSTYLSSGGSVLLQPAVGTAHDGNVSIKMTPASSGGRMQIIYTMPAANYSKLVDSARYRVTVYYKSEGANFGAQLEAKAMSDYVVTPFTMTDGEWIKGEYDFTLDKSYGKLQLTFGIAYPGGNKGSMYIDNITLERIPWVEGVVLDKSESYMEVGDTLELSYELKPVGETSEVTFISTDPSIAEVDADGKITAKKPGTVDIIATAVSGNTAAKCTIYVVEEYVELESISLNKTTLNVNPGWQEKLTVSFDPTNATENAVVWESSDASVVKVDEKGNILVLKTGTATITATATASGKTASCVVTVADDASFASTSEDITVNFGMSETLDLSQILTGSYTVLEAPAKGKIELSGNNLKYTAYTWLMEQDGNGFTDAVYTDTAKIAVQSGDKSAIITLNVTINKLADLFYDENGEWITDVDMVFSQEYLDAIRAEIKADPNGERAKIFAYMLTKVDAKLTSAPAGYTYLDPSVAQYDEQLRGVADETVNFLMAYLLTKDLPGYEAKNEKYLEKTIEYAKAALEYPYWGMRPVSHRNSDLPAGHFLFSTSMVYYWLKEELKDETCTQKMGTDGTIDSIVTTENIPMLDALEERLWFVASEMFDHSKPYYVYVMNHCHVRMGGLMAATIALRADADTAEKQQLLIDYTGMVMYKDGLGMNSLMPDGTSQEGLPYWEYAAEWLIKAGIMIRQTYGIDLFETTHVFENSGDYVLYNLLPQDSWKTGSSVLNVGDSPTNHWYGPGQILRFIAAEYDKPNALWLAQQVEAAGIEVGTSQWMSVMFTDTEQEAVKPGLDNTLQWFKDMDHVIGRTDWSGNEDLLSIKCGVPCGLNLMELTQNGVLPYGAADAGHAHPDANHITLYSNGEFLLRDDGYRRKYAANHNTLLVNGQGQLGEGGDWMEEMAYVNQDAIPYIKIADYGTSYDYIVGNATEAYASSLSLELFERNVLWLKEEKVLLVVDNIKTLAETDLELHWFPQSKSAGISGDVYLLKTNKNVMNFYPLTDETTTAFEDILQYTATGTSNTENEKGFRQTYTGTNWQNAVAFSWDEADGEAAFVAYAKGENANEHKFGVNGKIYTINVATNKITVEEGELEVEGDDSASDSTLSTVMMNGVVFDEFDPSVTEYEIDRWWKTADVKIEAYTGGYGANYEVAYSKDVITLTCTSRDGTSKTVYTFKVTNSENILGIAGVETDRPRDGFDIGWTYDSVITSTNVGNIWANTGLPTVIYDLGKVCKLEDVIIAFNISARRDSYYDLAYSVDGETWIYLKEDATVEQTDGALNGWHDPVKVVEDANVAARYIKVKLRAHSQNSKDDAAAYCSIQEITFIGSEYTAVNVTGGTIADGKDFYEAGDEITVTAQVPEGKKFVRWEVEGIDVDDLTNPTITFTLGEDDVKLVAIFEDVIPEGGDDDTGDDDTGDDDNTDDDNTDDGEGDDGSSDTGDNAMLMPALMLAIMALVACAVLTVGKKYRR